MHRQGCILQCCFNKSIISQHGFHILPKKGEQCCDRPDCCSNKGYFVAFIWTVSPTLAKKCRFETSVNNSFAAQVNLLSAIWFNTLHRTSFFDIFIFKTFIFTYLLKCARPLSINEMRNTRSVARM